MIDKSKRYNIPKNLSESVMTKLVEVLTADGSDISISFTDGTYYKRNNSSTLFWGGTKSWLLGNYPSKSTALSYKTLLKQVNYSFKL